MVDAMFFAASMIQSVQVDVELLEVLKQARFSAPTVDRWWPYWPASGPRAERATGLI